MTGERRRPVSAVVLAAGEGTRMRSATPKVLHELCGRPMLVWVLDALGSLPLDRIVVVVGHGAEDVTKTVQDRLASPNLAIDVPVEFVEQPVQRGTGDAAAVALTAFADDLDADDDLLVLFADSPLIRPDTLAMLATEHRLSDAAATILTARIDDPSGYGRVIRDERGRVDRIVEDGDARPDELEVDEINPSFYCFRRAYLAPALRRLRPDNVQGQYYLTDVIGVLRQAGHLVDGIEVDDPTEVLSVNDRAQLADVESELRDRINTHWMREGVTMVDPATTYVDADVVLEPDVRILPNTMLGGSTVVRSGAVVGPDCDLVDTVVGRDAVVRQSVARDSIVGDGVTVGPYVSLRAGTHLAAGAHAGTFVEIKNSEIGEGAKVPHLSYVGDADVGERTNIGAGNITANYDGRAKHRTRIGNDVRSGSNTVFVAPVEVGDGAYTAAGSVVNRDVPSGALAKGVPAKIEEGWADRRENADDDSASEGKD
ncbi:MAG: bifunctional UDP-N-acetylglucosamine diphosphorylase/glucosamine-1-phosphate N-acetyltransferase GlmU [Acidimicrobiia bacterium]